MANPLTVSATRFRLALALGLTLTVTIGIVISLYGINYLNGYAATVNEVAIEADNTDARLGIMQQEAGLLAANQSAATRAQQIVAESQSYQYQDVIIRDLEEFAQQAGVTVQQYDFTSGTSTSTSSKPAPVKSGPKSTTVNIAVENPVNYLNLLRFIYRIEQNLTKMQIANISMNGIADNDSSINSSNFIIQVYIR